MTDSGYILPIFKSTGQAHIKLSKLQERIRDRIQEKINDGIYKFEDFPCLCGAIDDAVLAETDRYGLNITTVMCKNCGLLRTNPRFDNKSLFAFYKADYRDLYMGAEYGDMNNYFWFISNLVAIGKSIFND